ncbi:hypothetical protein PSECIP111951_00317 [Pseudoalteromonas holothuriae]|uniref:Uncharacterized protein n=1 Tax=Pseudoalteromonas holothuriae TaxID=2963714 RepID=A0ABM9GDL4_9GAMM|nr:hypothetical protein [Pseudoalteromonas sp. CIP111951]CAH9051046.1 hypothetical protein PSECIP111951_00317 [Pseudoalteromonas sp. CIP111951]
MHAKHDPVKMVALKLTTLSWIDRVWLLRQLNPTVSRQVKSAYKALNQIGIENPKELLAQFSTEHEPVDIEIEQLPSEVYAYLQRVKANEQLVTPSIRKLLDEHLSMNRSAHNTCLKEGR